MCHRLGYPVAAAEGWWYNLDNVPDHKVTGKNPSHSNILQGHHSSLAQISVSWFCDVQLKTLNERTSMTLDQ